jgi:hypothetical protein
MSDQQHHCGGKMKEVEMVGDVAGMEEMRNAFKVTIRKPEGKVGW